VALLCLLNACARKPATESDPAATSGAATATIATIAGPQWRLESFDTSEPAPGELHITIAVEGERLSGHAGCNRYIGPIRNGERSGTLSIGPLARTRMDCAPTAATVEARYLRALQHSTSFSVEGSKLQISYVDDDRTRTLTYARE